MLQFRNQHSNRLEEKLSAAHFRQLWNCLGAETVVDSISGFRSQVRKDETFKLLCEKNVLRPLPNV